MPERMTQPTHTQIHADITAQLRRLAQAIRHAGGFDPNETPVLIGNGATAGGGSTPSDLTGAFQFCVVVGRSADAEAVSAVAVGDRAAALGSHGVAVGLLAKVATGTADAVAVGKGALASADSAVAIGDTTRAAALRTTAVGAGSRAQADYSTALGGAWCNTSATQGVSIGVGSQSLAPSATSVGAGCVAATDSSIAMGNGASANGPASIAFNAVTFQDHEVGIGGASDTYFLRMNNLNGVVVQDDNAPGTFYRITVNSGALGIVPFP